MHTLSGSPSLALSLDAATDTYRDCVDFQTPNSQDLWDSEQWTNVLSALYAFLQRSRTMNYRNREQIIYRVRTQKLGYQIQMFGPQFRVRDVGLS
jgi:hypothetical protein